MGGTTYLRETTIKMQKYNKLISELRKKGKVVTCSQDEVDAWEKTLLKRGVPKIDDPHLVALISVSGCKLICSADSKADYIITDKLNYKPPTKPPKIIRSKSSKKLLHAKNVAGCCC
jgi:predicted nucleic acid-binding protein